MEALDKVYGINTPKKTAVYKKIQWLWERKEDLENDLCTVSGAKSKNESIGAVQNFIEN